MHSVRRAILRSAATSASRAVAVKPQTVSFASQISRSGNAPRQCLPSSSAARWFSLTTRMANTEEANPSAQSATETADSAQSVDPEAPLARDVEHAAPAEGNPSASGKEGETPYGVFIRNMVFDANEEHLREAFEKYGNITKIAIARDARGLSKGFGFVWFDNAASVNKSVAEVNGSFWHGRRIQVQTRTSPAARGRPGAGKPTKSLYIGNIPYETTDAELNRIFRELENVTDVRVAVDRTTGWPRGFAHADFTDPESAERARNKLQGTAIGGRELRLDFAESSNQSPRARRGAPPEQNSQTF